MVVSETPASRVIDRFGGQSKLARLIGKNQSTVQYWASTGRIPPSWHPKLLKLAASEGVNLAPSELVALPPSAEDLEIAVPKARWAGVLEIGPDTEVPVYVLTDGRRLI